MIATCKFIEDALRLENINDEKKVFQPKYIRGSHIIHSPLYSNFRSSSNGRIHVKNCRDEKDGGLLTLSQNTTISVSP